MSHRTPGTYCHDVEGESSWYHLYRFTLGHAARKRFRKFTKLSNWRG
jgi:hypothetical protein